MLVTDWSARLVPVVSTLRDAWAGGAYLDGLVGGVERKNGWQLAEHAGMKRPGECRRCLDAVTGMPSICRDYVVERLGDPSGILILDETGFVKKGLAFGRRRSSIQRQAGCIENCQIGVFLGHASPKGHALIDRRLYLPKEWIEDAERRKKTHVPDDVIFATKPKIGTAMVNAALEAGVPCSWVLGNSACGSDKGLRVMLGSCSKPYVLCVRGNERLMINGSFRSPRPRMLPQILRRKRGIACRLAKDRKAQGFMIGLAFVSCVCKHRPGTIGY